MELLSFTIYHKSTYIDGTEIIDINKCFSILGWKLRESVRCQEVHIIDVRIIKGRDQQITLRESPKFEKILFWITGQYDIILWYGTGEADLPVWAQAIKSLLLFTIGIACFWTGVGLE